MLLSVPQRKLQASKYWAVLLTLASYSNQLTLNPGWVYSWMLWIYRKCTTSFHLCVDAVSHGYIVSYNLLLPCFWRNASEVPHVSCMLQLRGTKRMFQDSEWRSFLNCICSTWNSELSWITNLLNKLEQAGDGFHPGQLSFLFWTASDTLPMAIN